MIELCFFHKGCIDGTVSASVLKKYTNRNNIIFIPLHYEGGIHKAVEKSWSFYMEDIKNVTRAWFLDIAPDWNDALFLKENGVSEIIIIDHHKTSINRIADILQIDVDETKPATIKQDGITIIYNPDECGASLTYKTLVDDSYPLIIELVKDRDLWLNRYEDTEAVNDYLSMFTNNVSKMAEIFDKDISEIASQSKLLSDYKHSMVKKTKDMWVNAPLYINVNNMKIPAVNSQMFPNEIGNLLAQKYGIACTFYITGDMVKLSFRSTDGTARRVAEILGGGGHDDASGAVITLKQLCKMLTTDQISGDCF